MQACSFVFAAASCMPAYCCVHLCVANRRGPQQFDDCAGSTVGLRTVRSGAEDSQGQQAFQSCKYALE